MIESFWGIDSYILFINITNKYSIYKYTIYHYGHKSITTVIVKKTKNTLWLLLIQCKTILPTANKDAIIPGTFP